MKRDLILTDVDDIVLNELRERAARHGRTPTEEAKVILAETLRAESRDAWESVDAIYSGTTGRPNADR